MAQAFFSADLFHEHPDGSLIAEASTLGFAPGSRYPGTITVMGKERSWVFYWAGHIWNRNTMDEIEGGEYLSPEHGRLVILND